MHWNRLAGGVIAVLIVLGTAIVLALSTGCQPAAPAGPVLYTLTDQECGRRCEKAKTACIVGCPANGDVCFGGCQDDYVRCNQSCGPVPVGRP